ncbi:MarR family winged helix-turn-helix transcriptional regulator [Paenibacillus sp. HJGM_3]|uniref:MarR family winged helix-turn-helix transcriptional regulator n=1 Tax=Paenibacillus sp. HJGM_3 TaxID=3379816 RepID=UPI00385B6C5A
MNREDQIIGITEMFRQMSKKWMLDWNKNKPNGLSPTHAAILKILDTRGPQKPTSLAAELFVTTGGVTGLTDKLVEAGYVKRGRDEADRRIVFLEITDAGRELLKEVVKLKRERDRRLFSALTDEEIDTLYGLYRKLTND